MIIGSWVAGGSAIVSASTLFEPKSGIEYAEATLKCHTDGSGSWSTPTIIGSIKDVELAFVDFGTAGVAWTLKSVNGATLFSAASTPSSAATRYFGASGASGTSTPIPVAEVLTFAVATDAGNNAKSIKVRIYVNTIMRQ